MRTQAALAAKEIRKELKVKFPGIKFRVVSQNYAGGDSVTVYYKSGEFNPYLLQGILSKYKCGSFDGMTDSYNYDNRNRDIPQAMYVITQGRIEL